MSTESEEGRRIVASLALRINDVADISQVVDAIITMIQDANAALVPIIGPKGVAALYRRSLYVCSSKQSRLSGTYTNLAAPIDPTELRSALLQQNPIDATFFGEELLNALYELLATLIGPSLSARLLFDVWDNSLNAPPAQETSP